MEIKPVLRILVGLPASGKSTYCKEAIERNPNIVIVSRDKIRFSMVTEEEPYFAKEEKVFDTFVSMINNELINGKDVIADATHLSKSSRAKLINSLTIPKDKYNIIFVFFDIDLLTCLVRNEKRAGREKVPRSVMRRMSYGVEAPSTSESSNVIGVEFI